MELNELTYKVESDDPKTVAASIDTINSVDNMMQLRAVSVGTVTVTVTAKEADAVVETDGVNGLAGMGQSATQTFTVTVKP